MIIIFIYVLQQIYDQESVRPPKWGERSGTSTGYYDLNRILIFPSGFSVAVGIDQAL